MWGPSLSCRSYGTRGRTILTLGSIYASQGMVHVTVVCTWRYSLRIVSKYSVFAIMAGSSDDALQQQADPRCDTLKELRMQLGTKTSELLEKLCIKQPRIELYKRCGGVKTHHLSMSPLMTWQDAGTASLESGILTEGSWSWGRCGAAVNSGYRLVTEMDGGREEGRRNHTDGARWAWVAMEAPKTPNFSPHLLCLFYFTAPLHFIPPVLSDSFIPLFVLQSSQWICIEVPFWVKHFASQRPHNASKTLTGGGLFSWKENWLMIRMSWEL